MIFGSSNSGNRGVIDSDKELYHLRAINAELLAALEECLREHGGFTIKGQCEKRARAAIKRAKEAK